MPMTYNSLTIDIIQNAQRTDDDFIAQVPRFIERAITRIYTETDNIGLEIYSQENGGNYRLNENRALVQKRANWKKTISLSYIDPVTSITNFLLPRSYESALMYNPNPAVTGVPLFYSDQPTETPAQIDSPYLFFYISPTPSFTANLNHVWIQVPEFSPATATNFLTQRYPALLFYGCMVEAMTYLKDDMRLPIFEKLYGGALGRTNTENQQGYGDRTTKREDGS